MDIDFQCVICYREMHVPSQLPCDHIFCANCIDNWLKEANSCPMCREIVPQQSLEHLGAYLRLQRHQRLQRVFWSGDIVIEQTAIVEPSCEIGNGVVVHGHSVLHSGVKIHGYTSIGSRTNLSNNVEILKCPNDESGSFKTMIGNGVLLSPFVVICYGTYICDAVTMGERSRVVGPGVVILQNVRIGKDCVIEANVTLGRGVTVCDGVRVRGRSIVPPGTIVDHDSEFACPRYTLGCVAVLVAAMAIAVAFAVTL